MNFTLKVILKIILKTFYADQTLSEDLQQFQPMPKFVLPLNRRLGKTTMESKKVLEADGVTESWQMVEDPGRAITEYSVGYSTR